MIRSLFDSSIKAQLRIIITYVDQLNLEDAWSAGTNLTLRTSTFLTFLSAFLILEVNREFNHGKVLTLPDEYDPDEHTEYELVEIQHIDANTLTEFHKKEKKLAGKRLRIW